MKAKNLRYVVAAILAVFALCATVPAYAQMGGGDNGVTAIKIRADSGPTTQTSALAPADFASPSVNSIKLLTPAEAATTGRIFFGSEITLPVEASVTLTEISWKLLKDGNPIPWRSGTVPFWIQPGTAVPYLVAYNAAGIRVSSDFATSTGTSVPSVKKIVLGNHRFTLGTATGQQPLFSGPGASYAMGYRIVGSYTVGAGPAVPFALLYPGESISGTSSINAYAAVGVRPAMTAAEWVAQLKPQNVVNGEGWLSYILTDPSGLVGVPGGYNLPGLDWSTDLQNWFRWSTINSTGGVDGNTLTFNIETGNSRPRFFVRGREADVTVNGVSWWPAGSPNS